MNSQFDPFIQNVTFRDAGGFPFEVPVANLDLFVQYSVRMSINYAAQFGASVIVLVILFLLTKPKRRKSAVFCLNISALFFNVCRLVSQFVYFTGPWREVYAYFGFDFSRVPRSAYAGSILSVVFSVLLLIAVELSLVLQVQVLCATLRRRYRLTLVGVSYLIALITLAFRVWYAVENCIKIINVSYSTSARWLAKLTNIILAISVCFFCLVFVIKLGYAIALRKRLGLREFGPMKVIFIMGCQTMFIPVLFVTLQYVIVIPELTANCLTIISISLPLSSLWAGCTLDRTRTEKDIPSSNNSWSIGSSSTARTLCYADQRPHPLDLEAGHGIAVAHDISIQTFKDNKGCGVNMTQLI